MLAQQSIAISVGVLPNSDTLSNCPDDYTYNRKTNLCVKMSTDILNLNAAKSKCESFENGGLVTIRNHNQHDFIVQELAKIMNPPEPFYIDGTDEAEEGKFIGKDGKEITYLDWDSISQMDMPHEAQDFLCLNPTEDYKYEDVDGTRAYRYICEVVSK
ncbi:unnamed protein product [Mytilus edulis]|uniref:C-type lectin domain-containing protein n=1 Tax=Mytilus edulis TaxID=6550 RepID=A0A8S3VMA4_MYTED|nr:unnamed protein product [Mytilus edulis]